MPDKTSDEEKAKHCRDALGELARIRQPYEAMIDNIFTYVYHGRRKIVDNRHMRGNKTGAEVYDGTALQSMNLSSDGLAGYTISKSFRWYNYTLPGKFNFPRTSGMRAWTGKRMDEYPDVKNWLESAEEVMYAAFLRSNLYDVASDIVRDAMGPGTVSVIIEENIAEGRLVFTVPHFREMYIAENADGKVDTRYRVYDLSLRQMEQKFGLEKCEKAIPEFKSKLEKNPYEQQEIIHATYPRRDIEFGRLDAKNKGIASMWLLKDKRTSILLESGFDDDPGFTWRWRKNSDEWYGRSWAWDSYIDIMTANQAGRSNIKAGQKMTDPPMVGPKALRGKINREARGWTWMDGGITKDNVPRPLLDGLQLPYSIEMQERFDRKIRENFHVDFFLMLTTQAARGGPELKVVQILEMQAEKAAILGPRIGHMESEAMNPLHDRCFAIEQRAGRIPPPPDILLEYAGSALEVDYVGPMAQAQKKLFRAQGIISGLDAASIMFDLFPESKDVIKVDETTKDIMEAHGFPSKDIRDDDDVAEIRRIRQEQEQEDEAKAMMLEGAKAIPAAGTAPDEGSPLGELMGVGGEA